jgi:iron complex outermembrane receptor protein
MKKVISILVILFSVSIVFAQEVDSLQGMNFKLDEVVITATRTKRIVGDVPAQVDVIGVQKIENFPVFNVDDILKSTANVYVNRSWGIFSKNSSVTMRGLSNSDRTLVLLDGVPKNKIAGGSVNWHNINLDNIERIEIIKGPASALYGNNAMGGVINIITKKPVDKLDGTFRTFYGSCNTVGGSLNLSGADLKNDKGFYWNVNGNYRQGDGYIFEDPELVDYTDVETYLKEYGGGTKLGYQFNKSNSIEVIYDHYDETRGSGRKVFLEDGGYENTLTNQVKARYVGKIGEGDFTAVMYYIYEDFYGQKESLNDYNEYRLLDSRTDKSDKGFLATYSRKILNKNYITIGSELKMGDVIGSDIYRTSSDVINFHSNLNLMGFFIQDEINFMQDKLKVIAGLRSDYARFYDGFQSVTDPTKTTGFTESFTEDFEDKNWGAISPKLALQYSLTPKSKLYASVGVGYKPPKLKDLGQTGKIRKGFRLANPNLKPETLTNYEIGYSQLFSEKVKMSTAVYYSLGTDFHYMVGNGDSIDTGGSSLKPILQYQNIGKVGIAGAEMSLKYFAFKTLYFNLSYSYNYSTIIDYEVAQETPDKDLTGKKIVEVSPHLFYADMNYKNKYFSLNINCNYVGEQWYDDENTVLIEDYFLLNARLSKTIKVHSKIYIDIQNILDNEYVDRKGQLSPGRFVIAGFQYSL